MRMSGAACVALACKCLCRLRRDGRDRVYSYTVMVQRWTPQRLARPASAGGCVCASPGVCVPLAAQGAHGELNRFIVARPREIRKDLAAGVGARPPAT